MKVVQTSGCGSRHPQLCPDFPPPVETVDHPTVSNELHSQDKAGGPDKARYALSARGGSC